MRVWQHNNDLVKSSTGVCISTPSFDRTPQPTTSVFPAKAGTQVRGAESHVTPIVSDTVHLPHLRLSAQRRNPPHRRPGEGRGPGAVHGNRPHTVVRGEIRNPLPSFRRRPELGGGGGGGPPPSVIPDPAIGDLRVNPLSLRERAGVRAQ